MAAGPESFSLQMDLTVNMAAEISNDSVSLTTDEVITNQNNFPELTWTDGDSVSVSGGQMDWILHDEFTIAAGATHTIDLTAVVDRASNTTIAKSYVQYCVVTIVSPAPGVGSVGKFQMGQFSDTAAVPFGESTSIAFTERTKVFLYDNQAAQDATSLGTKILIKNSSTVTITTAIAAAGNRF